MFLTEVGTWNLHRRSFVICRLVFLCKFVNPTTGDQNVNLQFHRQTSARVGWWLLSMWSLPSQLCWAGSGSAGWDPYWGFLHQLVLPSVPGTLGGDCKGPLQTAQGIREIKSCSEKLDFIPSDPTEFLTVSGQGTKQELCRWLCFACLCLAGLLSAGCDLKHEREWKSRWQTEMPSPLAESHSWSWRGVCQNRCQCCLVQFSCVWNISLVHTML